MAQPSQSVSAIVPCYNADSTIERCLVSILEQTHPVKEILVYDDCSTDNSAAILARMAEKHPNISIFSGTENKGAGHSRTMLLRAAQGAYLAFLDADDVWHPTKLEIQLDLMDSHASDISACDYEIFDAEGQRLGTRRLPRSITRFKMHLRNEIPTSMAVLRSDLKGCRAMPMLRRRQDYAYWLNIFAQNPSIKCVSTPEVLGTYYRMPGSLSSSMTANLKANYYMFRNAQGYSAMLSGICVCANVMMRIMRI
jgi:teichuronic acid biosynthesis glycosyltransferase TuaG